MDYVILSDIKAEELMYIRKLVNWNKPITLEQYKKAVDNTMCKVLIKNNKDIIGLGRLVGDYSVLSDIIDNPKYQGMGYGKIIVTTLIKQVKDTLKEGEYFQIEATPTYGNRDFYIKCGMKYKPENQDGVYIWITK